jgi:hypothetical protein
MWLVTTQRFYSVIEHEWDADKLLVRARVRADLETLRAQIPDLEIFSDRRADYRWRAAITRTEWVVALAQLAEEIDDPNFKVAVTSRIDGASIQEVELNYKSSARSNRLGNRLSRGWIGQTHQLVLLDLALQGSSQQTLLRIALDRPFNVNAVQSPQPSKTANGVDEGQHFLGTCGSCHWASSVA